MDDRCSVMLTSDLVSGRVALVDKSNLPNNNGLLPTPNGGSPHQDCHGVVIVQCTHSPTHRTDAHLFLSTSCVTRKVAMGQIGPINENVGWDRWTNENMG